MTHKPPVLLSIAGSDSSAGAGVQADIKTCAALGVYATTALTTITAQNMTGVSDIFPLSPKLVRAQCEAVLSDFTVNVVKIGLLGSKEIIQELAQLFTAMGRSKPYIILDPVMGASSGKIFLDDDQLEFLTSDLLPHCYVITPNIQEAERLLGSEIRSRKDMEKAAKKLVSLNMARHVVITGGEGLEGGAHDCLFTDDTHHWFKSERISSPNTHGTGCVYSTALACFLARGFNVKKAAQEAKSFVMKCLLESRDMSLGKVGKSPGPVVHSFIK